MRSELRRFVQLAAAAAALAVTLPFFTLPAAALAEKACPDSSTTIEVDLQELSAVMGEALAEVAEVMKDLQIQVRMGQDNRMDLSVRDKNYQLDVDEIIRQVSEAVEDGLDGIDADHWTHVTVRGESDADLQDLRAELDDLRQELQDLQRDLAAKRAHE